MLLEQAHEASFAASAAIDRQASIAIADALVVHVDVGHHADPLRDGDRPHAGGREPVEHLSGPQPHGIGVDEDHVRYDPIQRDAARQQRLDRLPEAAGARVVLDESPAAGLQGDSPAAAMMPACRQAPP